MPCDSKLKIKSIHLSSLSKDTIKMLVSWFFKDINLHQSKIIKFERCQIFSWKSVRMEVQWLKKQSGFANWSEEGETELRETKRLALPSPQTLRTTSPHATGERDWTFWACVTCPANRGWDAGRGLPSWAHHPHFTHEQTEAQAGEVSLFKVMGRAGGA